METSLTDVPAEIIALMYRYRWTGMYDEEELLSHISKLKKQND